jgi:hypothetical protein
MVEAIEKLLPRKVTAFEKAVIEEAIFYEDSKYALHAIVQGELLDYEDEVAAIKKECPKMPQMAALLWFHRVTENMQCVQEHELKKALAVQMAASIAKNPKEEGIKSAVIAKEECKEEKAPAGG